MKIRRNIWIWILFASIGFDGCSDINSLHDQYLQRGVTIHVGQPDSVKLFPGRDRVMITYRSYDPKVGKITVYWDFRQGSATFDVPTDRLGEELEMYVTGLKEKHYTFELVASNHAGLYPSIPLSISGQVYGDEYEASLTNRKIGSATVFPLANNKMDIALANALETMVGVELLYRNSSDEETIIKVANDETNLTITDSKEDAMMYRTLHVPEINCLDTFHTSYTPINFALIEEEQLDRLLFKRWNPPGIPNTELAPYTIELMWDGTVSDTKIGFISMGTLPYSITFELGQLAMIRRFKLYPRIQGAQAYVGQHPKVITVWGSSTPDVTADFASWIYLGEFNSVKPSGPGPVTAEDTGYARGGEDFFTTDNITVPVRYLRFHILESWASTGAIAIMGLELFGVPEVYLDL